MVIALWATGTPCVLASLARVPLVSRRGRVRCPTSAPFTLTLALSHRGRGEIPRCARNDVCTRNDMCIGEGIVN